MSDLSLISSYLLVYLQAVLYTFIGVFIANLIIGLGLSRYIAKPFKPLIKISKAPDETAVILSLSMLDSRMAHAILASLFRDGFLTEANVISIYLMIAPFAIMKHLIRYYIPVVLTVLTFSVAVTYIMLSLVTQFMKLALGISYSRRIAWRNINLKIGVKGGDRDSRGSTRDIFKSSLHATYSLMKIIIPRYLIAISILIVLMYFNVFRYIELFLRPYLEYLKLSPYSIMIIATRSISPVVGLFIAGDLLSKGFVSFKECLASIFIGKLIFSVTSDYPRNAFPFYTSVYPVKLAVKLTLVGITTTIIINLIIIALILITL